jgi:hypothetical protein
LSSPARQVSQEIGQVAGTRAARALCALPWMCFLAAYSHLPGAQTCLQICALSMFAFLVCRVRCRVRGTRESALILPFSTRSPPHLSLLQQPETLDEDLQQAAIEYLSISQTARNLIRQTSMAGVCACVRLRVCAFPCALWCMLQTRLCVCCRLDCVRERVARGGGQEMLLSHKGLGLRYRTSVSRLGLRYRRV